MHEAWLTPGFFVFPVIIPDSISLTLARPSRVDSAAICKRADKDVHSQSVKGQRKNGPPNPLIFAVSGSPDSLPRTTAARAMQGHNNFLKLFLHQGVMKSSRDRHGNACALHPRIIPERDSLPVARWGTRV
jgi:hypothetical protein